MIVSSVSFCTSVSSRLRSSSLMSCFFSSALRWSMPSRRTLRTAIRAFSAYWPTSLASSLRRSSVRSGIGRRMIWPSVIGLMPRLAATDRLFDRRDVGPVPHLDADQPRLGHRHGRHLVERHVGAIDLDLDAIDQRGRGAAGAQAAKVVLQGFDRAVHAALEVGGIDTGRHFTLRPERSSRCPRPPAPWQDCRGWRMLNTTIGMSLSRHRATAAASMTLRSSASTWSKLDGVVALGAAFLLGVGVIDAVDAGALEQGVALHFRGAQRGRRYRW